MFLFATYLLVSFSRSQQDPGLFNCIDRILLIDLKTIVSVFWVHIPLFYLLEENISNIDFAELIEMVNFLYNSTRIFNLCQLLDSLCESKHVISNSKPSGFKFTYWPLTEKLDLRAYF